MNYKQNRVIQYSKRMKCNFSNIIPPTHHVQKVATNKTSNLMQKSKWKPVNVYSFDYLISVKIGFASGTIEITR